MTITASARNFYIKSWNNHVYFLFKQKIHRKRYTVAYALRSSVAQNANIASLFAYKKKTHVEAVVYFVFDLIGYKCDLGRGVRREQSSSTAIDRDRTKKKNVTFALPVLQK